MRHRINGPVLDFGARRILAQEIVTLPVSRWPDRPGNKSTTTVRAHIAQNIVNAGDAERTLVSANTRHK